MKFILVINPEACAQFGSLKTGQNFIAFIFFKEFIVMKQKNKYFSF